MAARPEAAGRTYLVGDSRTYSSREIHGALRAVLHERGAVPPAPIFTVLAWAWRAGGRLHQRLAEIIDRLIGSACYLPARIERELGWLARIRLADGPWEMLGGGAGSKSVASFASTNDFRL
ncbi:MAG: hypothetical protein NNA22_06340 [Nitrospira sp.]|nr:hypothetical protein [Nitrospira sp.]